MVKKMEIAVDLAEEEASSNSSVVSGDSAESKQTHCCSSKDSSSSLPEVEMMKERFAKLVLGEDMSGCGNGVSSIIFGQLWRLEPLPIQKTKMWRREMEWLLSVSNHIVEMIPTCQTFPDGTKLEIMTCRPRSDLYSNLPALRKLDNMLLEVLEGFREKEFWYVEEEGGCLRKRDDKWWLPVPRVPSGGLLECTRKQLQNKRESTNQILKAAMAINTLTLADMNAPHSYLQNLSTKSCRATLGDVVYRYITSDQFSEECLLDCLDLESLSSSSEHKAVEIANRIEASVFLWRHNSTSTSSSSKRSSWGMVKELMIDVDNKRQVFANRGDRLLLCLKQRFPGLPQTALDITKIQYNKDIGKSILESYSRVLESLAFNIIARMDDLLYVDDLSKHSDQYSSISRSMSSPFIYEDSQELKRRGKH